MEIKTWELLENKKISHLTKLMLEIFMILVLKIMTL
jgi:hypothetical protein